MLIVYYVRLSIKTRKHPELTAIGRHTQARLHWAELVAGGEQGILVVQTLRNWIMSSTFLASTAILFAIGLVGVVTTVDRSAAVVETLNFFGSPDSELWTVKILVLVVDFLVAFFNFSLSVRALIHAGFMLNVPVQTEPGDKLPSGLEELERGARHYTLGMRAYYLALPISFWLFGPIWMFIGTLLVLTVLRTVD